MSAHRPLEHHTYQLHDRIDHACQEAYDHQNRYQNISEEASVLFDLSAHSSSQASAVSVLNIFLWLGGRRCSLLVEKALAKEVSVSGTMRCIYPSKSCLRERALREPSGRVFRTRERWTPSAIIRSFLRFDGYPRLAPARAPDDAILYLVEFPLRSLSV